MNLLFKQEALADGLAHFPTRIASRLFDARKRRASMCVCMRAQCPFVKTSALSCNQSERPQRTDEASAAQQDEVLSENTLKKTKSFKKFKQKVWSGC